MTVTELYIFKGPNNLMHYFSWRGGEKVRGGGFMIVSKSHQYELLSLLKEPDRTMVGLCMGLSFFSFYFP